MSSIGIDIFVNIHCLYCGISFSLMICYHATAVTYAISTVGDEVHRSNWYTYPVKIRKYVVLIICHAQQTADFTSFKILDVKLQTFEKVWEA